MRRNLLLLLFCLPAFSALHAQISAVDSVADRYRDWLTGEGVDYSNASVNDRYLRFRISGNGARDLTGYDLVNPGPVWNLSNNADHNAFTGLITGKLIRLVFLYQIKGPVATPNPDYHLPSLRDTILSIFNYVRAKGISDTTTFGAETYLRTSGYAISILLMKQELVAAGEFAYHMKVLAKICATSNPLLITPYADELRAMVPQRLCHVLAQDDTSSTRAADMISVRNFLNAGLFFGKGWSGTIKPDFTTYHHLGPYSSAYGVDALHQASILNKLLKGTSYELSDTAQNNLKNTVLTYRKFSIDFTMPRGLAGRSPTATSSYEVLRPALAYLYMADPVANADAGREFIRLWGISPSLNLSLQRSNQLSVTMVHTLGSMEDMADVLNAGLTPVAELMEGQFSFPYAGLSVHKYNGWQASVKGTSKHVWHFENGATENRQGAYGSAGAMELLAHGNPVVPDSNGLSLNGWDWAHIPGTTVANVPFSVMSNYVHREFNGRNFLAHAALDSNGVFAMDYRNFNSPTQMTALKTYFFFKNKILCLGSNIRDVNGTYPIHTTLFQTSFFNAANTSLVNGTAASGNNYTFNQTGGGLWATDAVGNGFVVPANAYNTDPITITRSNQSSPNPSNTATTTGDFAKAYIDHGTAPQAGTYQYAVQIQGGAATQGLADSFASYFQVLQQDSQAHVVKYVPDSIFSYALFDTAAAPVYDLLLKTDKPAVVMTQQREQGNKLKLSLTNPNLGLLAPNEAYTWGQLLQPSRLYRVPQTDVVKITLQGLWQPEAPQANVSVTANGANTEVSFSTINGLTIQTVLVKTVALLLPLSASLVAVRTRSGRPELQWDIERNGHSVADLFLEQSPDGSSWRSITRLPVTQTSYTGALGEASFVRLAVVQEDGHKAYSNTIWLTASGHAAEQLVCIVPNPSTGEVRISAGTHALQVLSISDAAGRLCTDRTTIRHAGTAVIIDLSLLEAGVYIVRTGSGSYKVVKQ